MKKVLIAHQSTIPHYRIPFYNALERLRPTSWEFQVVFDPNELKSKKFFKEQVQLSSFEFPILESKTYVTKFGGKKVSYQTFWPQLSKYDLVIIEHALNNLAYPLSHLNQISGLRLAYWGIGRDMNIVNPSLPKSLSERIKILLARKANAYFAYTSGVKAYLEQKGISAEKIFVLNNTIDINVQRKVFEQFCGERESIRKELGIQGKKVLLFVGRFTKDKRVDFLLRAFSLLYAADKDFQLLMVGSGDESIIDRNMENVTCFGPVVDLNKLGPIYVASDLFAFPRGVGLGPLQAFCYDLPTVTMQSVLHGPEFEYLSPANSVVLPEFTTEEEYAQVIREIFDNPTRLHELRAGVWPSIRHLTIEQMAENFIGGVNSILKI